MLQGVLLRTMPPAEPARCPIHYLQTLDGGAGDADEQQQEGQQQEGSEDEADAIGAMAARRRQVRRRRWLVSLRWAAPEQPPLSLRDMRAVTLVACFCAGPHHTAYLVFASATGRRRRRRRGGTATVKSGGGRRRRRWRSR